MNNRRCVMFLAVAAALASGFGVHGATARPGERLRVRVLFLGQPLAGAEVARGDGLTPMKEDELPRFKTDADGVATTVLLAIDHRVAPSETPDLAAADLYNATLWFAPRRR